MRVDVIELPAAATLGEDAPALAVRVGPARLGLSCTGEVELRQLRAGQLVAVYQLASEEPPRVIHLASAHQLAARRSRATATLSSGAVLTVQELAEASHGAG